MNLSKRVAIFSDLHLGVHKNDENWLHLLESWVDYFIKECNSKKITQILFLGDYFHYRDQIDVQTFQFGVNILKKICKDFSVIMITGNHDCYLKETSEIHSLQSFKKWPNVEVFDTYTKGNIGDKTFAFVPWGCEIEDRDLDYVFGHFEITSFQFNKYSVCNNGLDPLQIVNKTNRVFSGHFHMNHEKTFKDKTITYIGSPLQMEFGDVGNQNGFYILDFEHDKYEFIQNVDFPEHKILKISNLKKDIKTIKKDFVKVVVDDKITENALTKVTEKLHVIGVKDIQFDHVKDDIVVDNSKISDNIQEFDIKTFIREFVDSLDIENELKDKVKTKSIKYYESKE